MQNRKYETIDFTFDGKRYKVRGKTKEEVILKKAAKIADLEKNAELKSGSVTVRKWATAAFENYKPNLSEEYKKEVLYRVEKHILADIGPFAVNSITPMQCQQIINAQAGKSKSHINKLAQELFFIFDTARKNKLIATNPADSIVKPTGTKNTRRALTPEERKHLLQVIPTDPRFVFFELMLYCGCRPAEAAEARAEDLQTINGVLFLHIRGTKTANSDRLVPVPYELLPRVQNLQPGSYLAPNLAGRKHGEQSYRKMVSSLKRALNISMGAKVYRNELIPPLPLAPDFTPYLLRHTYCTDLKKKGVDVRIAKNLMGHADIKTTANIYDHADNESLMLAAAQMGLVTNS